jgi:hypothetical protein
VAGGGGWSAPGHGAEEIGIGNPVEGGAHREAEAAAMAVPKSA